MRGFRKLESLLQRNSLESCSLRELRKSRLTLPGAEPIGVLVEILGKQGFAAQADAHEDVLDVSSERVWRSIRGSAGTSGRQHASYPAKEQQVLTAGIIGAPNAGKSTLVNQLVGCKVSAVSDKTNTTRIPMLGAFTEKNTQVVLMDTPGIIDSRHLPPKHTSTSRRVSSAWKTMEDCGLGLFVLDAFRQVDAPDPRVTRAIEEYHTHFQETSPPPLLLVLNKMDKFSTSDLGKVDILESKLRSLQAFEQTFRISAANGAGVPALKSFLHSRSRPGQWLLDPDQVTDLPDSEIAIELVREKLFLRLRQELPYRLQIRCQEHKTLKDGSMFFKIQIFTPTDIVHHMVVGRNGSVVGEIGMAARTELRNIFKSQVHLYVDVVRGQGATAV